MTNPMNRNKTPCSTKQAHDPQQDEAPAKREDQGAFDVSVHPGISVQELSHGTVEVVRHFFVWKMSHSFEHHQPAIFEALLQLRG
jgi:hypothetical protein